MSVECGRVRSHGWWRNLVEHGAWGGPGQTRVSPPAPETFEGIARLFGTSVEQVKAMIAADWYGVESNEGVPARVLRMSPLLDSLDESDAEMVEKLTRRLANGDK